jgi:hypothetical protein
MRNRPKQKLVSFIDNSIELEKISADINDGWRLISLVKNGNYYVGIMEQIDIPACISSESIFIPPRKKIKISR